MEMDLNNRIEQAIGKLENKYERLQKDLMGQNSTTVIRFLSEDLKDIGRKLDDLKKQQLRMMES